ncbi:DUF2946 domain-containing protein [Paraburkholderia bannensis]|uniref:DUF2946 domain-containing protein n=1 Tax=Paraburkholderia bannensis TaxID=765414 RepID=UPI0004832171|nr:DUF2946 domain-containing protein [Paraburkholderia bannensis]
MYRARLHRLGSLLGLLAILLATLAPVVSQVLASQHRLSDALTAYCSADDEVVPSVHDGKPTHGVLPHWQACGYCGMVGHIPTLPGNPASLFASLTTTTMPVIVALVAIRADVSFTKAQPRAPPVFS